MIDGVNPYPAYKDSGVSWLGDVPEHWEVQRLRTVAEVSLSGVDRRSTAGETVVRFLGTDTVYGASNIDGDTKLDAATATPSEIMRFQLRRGDVVITKDSLVPTRIAFPALVSADPRDVTVCGYHLALVRPRATSGIISDYIFRVLGSSGLADYFLSRATGTTIIGIGRSELSSAPMPIPPEAEQAALGRFLDHADRRIRRYIAAKNKLIALLNEQKRAIIHRAVTRGLDPSAHLKASGLEWLGDIPAHWEVRRNGQLFAQRNQKGFGELPILEVSLKTGVRAREFADTDRKQVMSDREQYKRAAKGDIAYNMMRMWQGAVGIAPINGLVSPAYVVARPRDGVVARYFTNLFRTAAYMGEVDNASRGIVKDRNRLYWEDFKQLHSPYPPPDEQERIVTAIDTHAAAVSAEMVRVQREIALLREFRTRLIADVVTGKIDVRAAAARLPHEGDEPEPLDDLEVGADGDESGDEADLDAIAEEAEA
jgi:type I restriction enzyme S subunit